MAESECEECKIKFLRKDSLRTHAKRMHPDKVDILAPKAKKKVGSHICKKCQDTFSNFSNLRVHIKRKHPDQLEELAPIRKNIFKCGICQSEFGTLREFNMHKNTHKIIKMLKCPLCPQSYSLKGDIIRHYTDEHAIKIENETIEFSSFDDFQAWKVKIEKETFASFITRHGFYENPTTKVKKILYMCHRSGDIKRRGSNIRSLKTQGSNKINAYCPANMNVVVEENKCRVTFCKTHTGHKQEEDMGHLFLSALDKQSIAAKIAAKIPLDTILDEVRDTVLDCKLERIHLLTRQDLYNIEKAFNLNKSSIRNKNDAVSVEAWVNELKSSGSILLYKPQDSVDISIPSTSDAKQKIEERKRNFLQLIQDEISKVSTSEEMDAVEKIYAPIKPTLAALRSQQQFEKKFVGELTKTPSNKKIEPQRRLFSTKKRNTQKASLAKPTAEEADMLAVQILMDMRSADYTIA